MAIQTSYSQYVLDQISEKFDQYDSKSLQVWVLIETYMAELMNLTATFIELADIQWSDGPTTHELNMPTAPTKPTLTAHPEDVPALEEALEPTDLTEQSDDLGIEGDLPEGLTGLRPLESAVFPGYPQLDSVDVPERPSVTKPSLVTVREIEDVTFPDILTSIDSVTPPVLEKYQEGAAYASDLLEKLKSTLFSILDNGGMSLGGTIEEAIFSRHEDRVRRQYVASADRLLAFEALNGMAYPSGARHAVAFELEDQYANALALASNDVMVEQARIARDQFQHAISEANKLEAILMEQHNAALERAFNAWRGYMELLINTFQAELQKVNSQIDVLKLRVDVAQTEQTVSIQKAEHDIRRNEYLLGAYQTDAQVAQTIVQAESTITQAQIAVNGDKLNAYRAEIDGIVQELQAYVAEVEAQVRAKGLDIDIRRVQVEEASVQTQRVSAINDAKVRFNEARTRWAESVNQARTQLFQVRSQNASNQNQSKTSLFGAETNLFSSEVQAELGRANNQMDSFRLKVEQEGQKVAHERTQAQINMDNAMRQHELILQPILKIFEAASQWFASLVTAGNVGANMSAAFGHHTSASESISESHSYQEYCDPTCTG